MNNNRNNVRIIIGGVSCVIVFVIIICAIISSTIFQFQNPDMTETRCLIENPGPSIAVVFAFIMFWIGGLLIKK